MKNARVLIVEDDEHWIETFRLVLDGKVAALASATTVDAAIALLDKHYFNVAIVDLSLEPSNSADETGMRFLAAMRDRGLDSVIAPIMCTGYGGLNSAVEALRDFKVVDFLPKLEFSAQRLTEDVVKALERHHCREPLPIEVDGERPLASLWKRHKWARREPVDELAAELHDLLRRLFRPADALWVQPLTAGQSGAAVLRVQPTYGAMAGEPAIVKFGKREKIDIERQAYEKYIDLYVSSLSTTQLESAAGRAMGALRYRLIGTAVNEVESFAAFYARYDVTRIKQALDNLFKRTCMRWYDNRQQPARPRNLVDLYVKGTHIRWNEVWSGAARSGIDLSSPTLHFPGIVEALPNPRHWLKQIDYVYSLPVWLAVTHGDLNEHNILVTRDGRCWLIDFYRTDLGHILRDFVELETGIKFNLTPTLDMAQRAEFERLLLAQPELGAPVACAETEPYAKAAAVIFHLRSLAADALGFGADSTEYYAALLLQSLNLLRLGFLHRGHEQHSRGQVLLSAALLCQRLGQRT